MKSPSNTNIPDELYSQLQELANEHHHSIDAEVLDLLQRGLEREKTQSPQSELVANIRRPRFTYPFGISVPDSVPLVREDRER